MALEFRYPDEVSPTTSWLPSEAPTPEHSQRDISGIIAQRSGDLQKVYRYRMSRSTTGYEYNFEALTDTDKANFGTFWAAALGETFRLKDPISGSHVTVIFDGYEWEWLPWGVNRWALRGLRLRKVAG